MVTSLSHYFGYAYLEQSSFQVSCPLPDKRTSGFSDALFAVFEPSADDEVPLFMVQDCNGGEVCECVCVEELAVQRIYIAYACEDAGECGGMKLYVQKSSAPDLPAYA